MGIRGGDVQTFSGARDYTIHTGVVTASSQGLADIIGATLQADAEQLEIVNNGGAPIYYQCDGTDATTADLPIANGGNYVAVGNATRLAGITMIAGGDVTINVIERVTR